MQHKPIILGDFADKNPKDWCRENVQTMVLVSIDAMIAKVFWKSSCTLASSVFIMPSPQDLSFVRLKSDDYLGRKSPESMGSGM